MSRNDENRDTPVFLRRRVGARREPDVVGMVGTAGEHLLPTDDVRVAITHGSSAQRRQVAPGGRLRVPDRELHRAVKDRR